MLVVYCGRQAHPDVSALICTLKVDFLTTLPRALIKPKKTTATPNADGSRLQGCVCTSPTTANANDDADEAFLEEMFRSATRSHFIILLLWFLRSRQTRYDSQMGCMKQNSGCRKKVFRSFFGGFITMRPHLSPSVVCVFVCVMSLGSAVWDGIAERCCYEVTSEQHWTLFFEFGFFF